MAATHELSLMTLDELLDHSPKTIKKLIESSKERLRISGSADLASNGSDSGLSDERLARI